MENKENVFNRLAYKCKKNRPAAISICICLVVLFCIILGVVYISSYASPKNLKEATGVIAKFDQHDTQWYDHIGGTTGAYLKIRFEDGTYFEATGINYDHIDRKLFEQAKVGEEITITYNDSSTRPNRIFSIEYNGVNYLSIDDILTSYKKESRTSKITGTVIICVSVVVGGVVIFVVNYKYRKNKLENS